MGKASRAKRERRARRVEGVSLVSGEPRGEITSADRSADLAAITRDRAFFDGEGATSYRREPEPGELCYLIPAGCDLVAVDVTEIRPGVRLRLPVFRILAALEIN